MAVASAGSPCSAIVSRYLLADRLRDLEQAGVVERAGGERYALTPRGEALRSVLDALVLWGAPLVRHAPAGAHAQASFVRTAAGLHPAAELLDVDDAHARVLLFGELVEGTPAEVMRRLAAGAPG